ncbi:MAG: hypothetical protein EON58_09845 [Alphaproteobacteria bacterium]|nr:MAG: hypothetical protein EON58_09845 [Alphaproteobacteria bacterium]
MENSSQVGRWSFRFDPDLTDKLYENTPLPNCDCTDCKNFSAAVDQAFSPPFAFLLRRLGIDKSKPAELCHYGTTGEPMPTNGWFHFVGHLDSGRDAWHQTGENTHFLDPEPFPGIRSIGFTTRLALVPDQFLAHPLVQLEFETVVPWVIPVPLA